MKTNEWEYTKDTGNIRIPRGNNISYLGNVMLGIKKKHKLNCTSLYL